MCCVGRCALDSGVFGSEYSSKLCLFRAKWPYNGLQCGCIASICRVSSYPGLCVMRSDEKETANQIVLHLIDLSFAIIYYEVCLIFISDSRKVIAPQFHGTC